MKILYLEDLAPDIDILRRYINSLGNVEFAFVQTVEEAKTALKKMRPDIFLVDIMLNGETAYEVIRFTFAQKLARHIIPVTARALPSEVSYYQSLGCDQIIAKPFTVEDLDKVFAQIVP